MRYSLAVHIISRKRLRDFWKEHPDSEIPLKAWFKIVGSADYQNFNELKRSFSKADKVGDKIVFDIGGNKYRLIAAIHFNRSKVYIRSVLTHKEYDKGGWKNG